MPDQKDEQEGAAAPAAEEAVSSPGGEVGAEQQEAAAAEAQAGGEEDSEDEEQTDATRDEDRTEFAQYAVVGIGPFDSNEAAVTAAKELDDDGSDADMVFQPACVPGLELRSGSKILKIKPGTSVAAEYYNGDLPCGVLHVGDQYFALICCDIKYVPADEPEAVGEGEVQAQAT